MKHAPFVIAVLMLLFLGTQVVGLVIVQEYTGVDTLPLNIQRPDIEPDTSFVTIFAFIIIATVLALLLLRFKLMNLWKFWFLLSIFVTLTIAFGAFIPELYAGVLAVGIALWKVFRPNVIIHNFGELFIYGGIAAIFAPLLTLTSATVLLVLISVYDYIAVRKTQHMIRLAKSQGEAKVFAGLLIPYGKNVAILGGGDMGFPLLYASAVMSHFNLGFLNWQTYLVPVFAALMLLGLFVLGQRKKFYPAMPYISIGCFVGLIIVTLVL